MASITVLALKNRVSAIPASRNTWRIIYDPSGKLLIIDPATYTRGAKGEHFYIVDREINLADITLDGE